MLLEKICGLELPSPLAGTGECTSPLPRCQLLRKFRYQLTAAIDYSGSLGSPKTAPPPLLFQPRPCCTTCCADSSYGLFSKDPYRSGTSRNDPTPGAIPPIYSPDPIRESDLARGEAHGKMFPPRSLSCFLMSLSAVPKPSGTDPVRLPEPPVLPNPSRLFLCHHR
jgi:hypothetical protein